MTHVYHEFDIVRILERVERAGNYSLGEVRTVPAGAEGTIIEVFDNGAAFEVEFALSLPVLDGDRIIDPGTWHVLTLTPDQVEAA